MSIVPAYTTVRQGEVVKVECLDWTGGQIENNDSADDIKYADLTQIHYLSGPIFVRFTLSPSLFFFFFSFFLEFQYSNKREINLQVEGAEPGDCLVVEIQDVQPFQERPWGFTGVFHKNNGGGFLDEFYPEAYVFLFLKNILYFCMSGS